MNKRRLLKLADLLEADARNKKGIKFHLGTVAGPSADFDNEGAAFVPKVDCGTTACAIGLAAISGEFKRAGLSYRVNDSTITTTMNGRATSYDHAGSRLFGITEQEANFLFTPSYYRVSCPRGAEGERYVAKRIRKFVAGKYSAVDIEWGA